MSACACLEEGEGILRRHARCGTLLDREPDTVVSLPARAEAVYEAVKSLLAPIDTDADDDAAIAEDLRIAATEAMNNCVEHAYAGIERCEGADGGCLLPVVAGLWTGPAGRRSVCIADRGAPLPRRLLTRPAAADPDDPPALAEGGFGWSLIHACTDNLAHERVGEWNLLTLERLNPATTPPGDAALSGCGAGSEG